MNLTQCNDSNNKFWYKRSWKWNNNGEYLVEKNELPITWMNGFKISTWWTRSGMYRKPMLLEWRKISPPYLSDQSEKSIFGILTLELGQNFRITRAAELGNFESERLWDWFQDTVIQSRAQKPDRKPRQITEPMSDRALSQHFCTLGYSISF